MGYGHERALVKSDLRRSFLEEGSGPRRAVFRELRGAGMQWPACDNILVDGALMDCKFTASSAVMKHLVKTGIAPLAEGWSFT